MAQIPAKIKCDCCYHEEISFKTIPEGWRRVFITVRDHTKATPKMVSYKDLCRNCEFEPEVRVTDSRLAKKREL